MKNALTQVADSQGAKMVTIKFRKINEHATIPSYANPGDAGLDLHSTEDYTLQPGERRSFGLGFQAEFPEGHVAHVWDKSSLSFKHGITTLGGVIDSSYRGEYMIVLLNTSQVPYEIKKGDKIAQLVITPIVHAEIEHAENLESSIRGEKGFGSSGR